MRRFTKVCPQRFRLNHLEIAAEPNCYFCIGEAPCSIDMLAENCQISSNWVSSSTFIEIYDIIFQGSQEVIGQYAKTRDMKICFQNKRVISLSRGKDNPDCKLTAWEGSYLSFYESDLGCLIYLPSPEIPLDVLNRVEMI